MKLLNYESKGYRRCEVYKITDGMFEAFCLIDDSISNTFPVKEFKTRKAAVNYGRRFLGA